MSGFTVLLQETCKSCLQETCKSCMRGLKTASQLLRDHPYHGVATSESRHSRSASIAKPQIETKWLHSPPWNIDVRFFSWNDRIILIYILSIDILLKWHHVDYHQPGNSSSSTIAARSDSATSRPFVTCQGHQVKPWSRSQPSQGWHRKP